MLADYIYACIAVIALYNFMVNEYTVDNPKQFNRILTPLYLLHIVIAGFLLYNYLNNL